MPSFLEQFKSLLQLPLQTGKKLLSQSRAKGLQVRAAPQLPAGGEQVDISETVDVTERTPALATPTTPIAQTQPLPPTGVGTTPTAGGQVGVPTQPLPPGGVSLATTTAAPPLGGITPESLAQFRELIGQQQTPEMLEEKREIQQLLEKLIPFRQQLIQAQAPTEAMVQLDAQIEGLQLQFKRIEPERGLTQRFAAAYAEQERKPVQRQLTELLFQRSVIGRSRAAEAQRAQAGITAIGEEATIRGAIAQLGRPAELPAGIQTELFKRAFPTAPEPTLRTVGNQLLELIPGQAPKILYSAPVGQSPFTTQQKLTNIRNARKDFAGLQEVKDFKEISSRMDILLEAQKEALITNNFIAVDQAIITTFNKITDPDSVVRESEYARTQSDQSLLNRLKGTVKAWAAGGPGLTQDDRDSIVRLAGLFREVAAKKYRNARKSAQGELKRFNLPTDVIPDLEIEESIEIDSGGVATEADMTYVQSLGY